MKQGSIRKKLTMKTKTTICAGMVLGLLCTTSTLAVNTSDSDMFRGSAQSDPKGLLNFKVASAADGAESPAPKSSEQKDADSAKCAQYQSPDADVGAVIRAGCKPTLAQMSTLMNNPVGNVAMWWNQIDRYNLTNPSNNESAHKTNYMGIVQWPQALTNDWNVINRVIYNFTKTPIDQNKVDDFGSAQGALMPPSRFGSQPDSALDVFGGSTTGFGDMYYVALFSPKKPIKKGDANIVWGAGFDVGMPTASDDVLGTGKWSAGPSALGVYLGPEWKFGALLQQYWSFAGKSDRSDVNMTNLQYFYYYSLSPTVSVGAGPNIIANWEQDGGDRFTVPVGIGINKTINFGKIPVRIGFETYYSVIQPDNVPGSKWDFRFYVIPAVPSALFKWMTKPLFGS